VKSRFTGWRKAQLPPDIYEKPSQKYDRAELGFSQSRKVRKDKEFQQLFSQLRSMRRCEIASETSSGFLTGR